MPAKTRSERLTLPVHAGHEGMALVFPFDPAKKWGERERHFVGGTLNGVQFLGEIGFRRRVFYTLLDDELLSVAALKEGDAVEVIVVPREATPDDLATPANLVWSRLGKPRAQGKAPAQPPMRRKR